MIRRWMLWTGVLYLPFSIAVAMAVGSGVWTCLGVAACVWSIGLFAYQKLVVGELPDRIRPSWRIHLLERPHFVHWAALHLSLMGWVVGLPIWLLFPTMPTPLWWALGGYGLGLLLFSWGAIITVQRLKIRTLCLRIPELPNEFNGLRIVHLSDLHVGSFTSPRLMATWLSKVRQQRADMIVITGDVVSSGVEFHDAIAQLLGELESPCGVYFVPGNHDYFGEGEPLFGWLGDRGVHVLRNEHVVLHRDGAHVIVAGVDDAWTKRFDMEATLRNRGSGTTILLAHDPRAFDEAAERGVELVLSGHTHGGQFAIPWLARWFNLTKVSTPYCLGVYRKGRSTLVVSAGMGCTGIPIRIGVPPEVLVLCLEPG